MAAVQIFKAACLFLEESLRHTE